MTDLDVNDTQPMQVPVPMDPPQEPPVTPAPQRKRKPWLGYTLLGILALGVILAVSAFAGYNAGINRREQAEVALVSFKAAEQFELAVQDINARQFQRARQRLEYVAQIEPEYPGLTERLAEVLIHANAPPTPVPTPMPTIAPIREAGDLEKLFAQTQQAFLDKDWSNTIETALVIRKNDPNFRAVAIDGLLFLALRNRGMDKIAKQADLEGGMYDLALAAQFGPLDYEAQGFMNWVSMYITGASFWQLDWEKVLEYFSELASALPGLSDRSGMTSRERYRVALKEYGLLLFQRSDFCTAADYLQRSLEMSPDPEIDPVLSEAVTQCQGGGGSDDTQPTAPPVVETPLPTVPVIDTPPPTPESTPIPTPPTP